MAKKSSKKSKKAKQGAKSAASQDNGATTAPPAMASLGTGRAVRTKVPTVTAKEKAALAKEAARANWAERMTSEGR